MTGGGARSALWARLVAAAIGRPLHLAADQRSGPAIGAAREEGSAGRVVQVDPRLREQRDRKRVLFHGHPP